MKRLFFIQSLRRSVLVVFLFLNLPGSFSQKGVSFYGGVGVNSTISRQANLSSLRNKGQGLPSMTLDAGMKVKYSRRFSFTLKYMHLRSHIRTRFKDLDVTYFNHYSQTGGHIGNLTFTDNIYLYGNLCGLSLNHEAPVQQSTLIFTLGINKVFYDSYRNHIDRHYESLPPSLSDLETRQSAPISGPNPLAISTAIGYEKMLYRNRLGVYARLELIYHFIDYSYEFIYSDGYPHTRSGYEAYMGLPESYSYTSATSSSGYMRYYNLAFHTLNFTAGIFYKTRSRAKEKPH